MYGRLLNTMVNIIFLVYIVLLISFYFLHEAVKDNINNLSYNTLTTVSISGMFTEELYNNLKTELFRYSGGSSYDIRVKYERKIEPGVYDTEFLYDTLNPENMTYPVRDVSGGESDEDFIERRRSIDPHGIITTSEYQRPMYKGDKITIYLEDHKQTLYGKLINAPFFGVAANVLDFRIKSLKSTPIARDAKNLVSGYDVIKEINNSNRTYDIYLNTEMSGIQNPKLFTPGTSYSATQTDYSYNAVTRQTGIYHIFENNYYSRVWEDNNLSGVLDSDDTITIFSTVK